MSSFKYTTTEESSTIEYLLTRTMACGKKDRAPYANGKERNRN